MGKTEAPATIQKRKTGAILLTVLSILMSLLFIFPLLWGIFVSLKPEGTKIGIAMQWFMPPYTIGNYPKILSGTSIPYWFFNSVFVAVASTLLTIIVTSMCAYAMAKIHFKGRNLVYFFFLIGMMVPGEATIVPLFLTAKNLSLINTYLGLILPGVAGSMNFIIMETFYRGIPNDLLEAATIDGAGNVSIYMRIMLPLTKTVVATIAILSFLGSWNAYLWPLICAMSNEMFTLPVGIPTFVGTYSIDYVMPITAGMVASIPAILVYILFEKQIVKGVSMSGIKG